MILAVLLIAQVQVTVSPMQITDRILSKRVAKVAMPWLVSMENQADAPVLISPSAIYRRVPQLQPIDYKSMTLLIQEAAQNDPWARAGRLTLDLVGLGAFLGAQATLPGGRLRWGTGPMLGLTAVGVLGPTIAQRLRGTARPIVANFTSEAWIDSITLHPGEAANAVIFTAPWKQPAAVQFTMDTATAPLHRVLR